MTFTKEQLQNLIEFNSADNDGSQANAESWEVHKLASMALAAMEAVPVAWKVAFKLEGHPGSDFDKVFESVRAMNDVVSLHERGGFIVSVTPFYTAPQPLTTSERAELENYRNAQQVGPDEIRLLQSEVTIWKDRWELLRELFREVADALGCDVKDNQAMLDKIEILQGAEPVQAAPDEMTACRAYDLLMEKGGVMSPVDSFVFAWNACRAAMQSGAVKDGWVACSERMPKDEEDVLCFGQYGDNDIDDERYQFMGWLENKGIWRVSDGDSQNRRARVTHWQPLPAAPQQESE